MLAYRSHKEKLIVPKTRGAGFIVIIKQYILYDWLGTAPMLIRFTDET